MHHHPNKAIKTINATEILLWLLRKRKVVRVTGNSMVPTLKPKDLILVNPQAYGKKAPQVDDIVIANHPHQSNLSIVKRVIAVNEDGACFLQGDNTFPFESTDSRDYGFVAQELILAQVTSRIP